MDLDLLCGTFALGTPARRWLLDPMPELVMVRGSDATRDDLRATVTLLLGEVARGGPGAELVSDRLVPSPRRPSGRATPPRRASPGPSSAWRGRRPSAWRKQVAAAV